MLRLAPAPAPRARRPDSRGRSEPRYFATSASTGAGAWATPSMIVLASRVSGIAAGSTTFALGLPFGRDRLRQRPVGAASVRRAGVFTGRPSSRIG